MNKIQTQLYLMWMIGIPIVVYYFSLPISDVLEWHLVVVAAIIPLMSITTLHCWANEWVRD